IEKMIAAVKENMTVEEVQDVVVKALMGSKHKDVAIAYQSYRAIRERDRVAYSFRRMSEIVEFGDDENSNKNYKLPSVVRDTIAGEYFRGTIMNKLPKIVAEAFDKRLIHWHDQDHSEKGTNCCLFDIVDMLENGTRVTNADIQTPNSVGTAMNVAMQIMASISATQYGGVSLSEFNEVFAKYAKKNFEKHFKDYYKFMYDVECSEENIVSSNDELRKKYTKVFDKAKDKTRKDIYDACQLFEYQTNSILGNASQTPFSTITFNIPTSWESEQIISSYFDVRMKGLGEKGIIAIFPKLSMIVVDGYNLKEEDPYYYLTKKMSKCMAKTYYPDVLNYSRDDYDLGRYYGRMGCRSRVNHDYKVNGDYKRMGRFNYGVVTLNLIQVALEANMSDSKEKNIEAFFERLSTECYDIMKESMIARYNFVKHLKAKESPTLFQYGGITRLEPEETIEKLLKTDQASVSYGYLGIDDCVRILLGENNNISTEEGLELGMRIASALNEQTYRIKNETGLPVSLYGSPVEAGIYTMFKKDLDRIGDKMPTWLKDRGYYTNSFHHSSELPIESFDKIELESKFIELSNGGNISYVENSGKMYNSDAIIELIQHAYDCGTQYFAVNTITDKCYECGFEGEITYHEESHTYECPHCGNKDGREMKVQRRSCGYISNYNITKAVDGRMKEIKNRVKHF
ncbi:MAG: anaerobic ribonucleoside-triphosphate reductase, partial [Fusobacteriaceae bacterium]